jgi:hypothetical protein
MNEAQTTWALVVGIDKYDAPAVRELHGAVADAIVAVGWLRRLGVPDDQIRLHAAASATSGAALRQLGLTPKPARNPDIWSSVSELRKQAGTRLFVFLFGHGLYEPSTRRLFLTQEAGVNGDDWTNMGIDLYAELFLSMSFSQQFLVFDGCLNKPYSDNARPVTSAMMYANVTGFTGDRTNRTLVGCYAASEDQLSAEIGGRGAFSRRLFAALDPDTPCVDAVDYDFATGTRTLNIGKVMRSVIQSVQADANALTPPLIQIPQIEIYGKGQSEPSVSICRLEDIPTTQLHLDVQPAAALPEVRLVKVEVDADPYWSLPLKAPPQVDVPVVARLPKDHKAIAECRVDALAPWDTTQARQEFTANTDRIVTLTLTPLPAAQAPVPPRIDGFSVKMLGPDGGPRHVLSDHHYRQAGLRLGLGAAPSRGSEVAPNVVITPHEDGPDFDVMPGATDAWEVASSWAGAIREVVSPEITVSTVLRGNAAPVPKPNLRLVLAAGGASRLAGLLADQPLVTIESPGTTVSMSPNQMEADPVVRVDPGPVRVGVELPWGSWSGATRVPATGEASIALPGSVGRPPLRVQLAKERKRMGNLILGVDGDRPRGTVRMNLFSDRTHPLVEADAGSAAWALAMSGETPTQAGPQVAVLVGSDPVAFPLSGRPMAVDRSSGGLRVEPLSGVPAADWDLLVATGRLDAVTLNQAVKLALEPSQDGILPLAAAYAVFAAQAWGDLARVVKNQAAHRGPSLDLDLLAIAVEHSRGKEVSKNSLGKLARWAELGAVPWFRWGVPIVLDQLTDAGDEPLLGRWRAALEGVQRGLSPSSTWTAWTEKVGQPVRKQRERLLRLLGRELDKEQRSAMALAAARKTDPAKAAAQVRRRLGASENDLLEKLCTFARVPTSAPTDHLLKQLRKKLGLAADASVEEVVVNAIARLPSAAGRG